MWFFFLPRFSSILYHTSRGNNCKLLWLVLNGGTVQGFNTNLNRLGSLVTRILFFLFSALPVESCTSHFDMLWPSFPLHIRTLYSRNHEKCMNQSNTLNKHINKILNIYIKYNKYFVRQMTLLHRNHCTRAEDREFPFGVFLLLLLLFCLLFSRVWVACSL